MKADEEQVGNITETDQLAHPLDSKAGTRCGRGTPKRSRCWHLRLNTPSIRVPKEQPCSWP